MSVFLVFAQNPIALPFANSFPRVWEAKQQNKLYKRVEGGPSARVHKASAHTPLNAHTSRPLNRVHHLTTTGEAGGDSELQKKAPSNRISVNQYSIALSLLADAISLARITSSLATR